MVGWLVEFGFFGPGLISGEFALRICWCTEILIRNGIGRLIVILVWSSELYVMFCVRWKCIVASRLSVDVCFAVTDGRAVSPTAATLSIRRMQYEVHNAPIPLYVDIRIE